DASPAEAIGESRVGSTKAAGPCAQKRDLATPQTAGAGTASQTNAAATSNPTGIAAPTSGGETSARGTSEYAVSTGEGGSAAGRATPSAGRRGTSVRSTPWGQHAANATGSCSASSAENTAGA